MEVVISLDDKKLKHYLGNCPRSYDYIYLGERKEDIRQILNEHAFKELDINDLAPPLRERLLKSYNDLIGKLGQKCNSIYWWATYTASKNRFVSKLSANLFLSYSLLNTLKENSEKNILVINPPKEICGSIKEYCLANSIDFRMLHNPLYSVFEFLKRPGQQIISRFFFICDSWQKIRIAHKHLGEKFASEVQRESKYYVLRSWFYSSSINQDNEYRDSFFGRLPEYLVKKGKKLLVVAGVIGDYKSIVSKIANNNGYFIVPQELFLGYMDPIRVIIDLYGNRIKIKGKIDFDGFDVSDTVRAEIDKDFRSRGILTNYMYYYWTKRMLNTVEVDTFTITCENNPWERMCTMALRQYSPETKILGYQHTVVPQASANMFVSEYEKDVTPMPDRILTVGIAPKRIMERYGCYDTGRIQEACALRFEYLFNIHPRPRSCSNCILVALEGVFEVYHLVNYVLRELKESTDYKIKIRTHPAMPLGQIIHKLDYDIDSFSHIFLSQNASLERDIDESDMVIYWGSTVGLEALMMGKPIIHFDPGDILSYDPLFECHHLKWVVSKHTNLSKVIEEIYDMSDEEYCLQLRQAKDYLDDYFYRITDQRLSEFII